MATRPWYHEGLRFQCTGCGDCCTGAPGYVWVNETEIVAIGEFLGLDGAEMAQRTRAVGSRISLTEFSNGDCVFFDSHARRCAIYEVRPRQCRTFPFWNSTIRSRAAWRGVSKACPGCGQGTLVTAAEIQARAAVIPI